MNYIPNIISGLRILLIPVFILLVFNKSYYIAILIFLIMGATDVIDGILARHLKCDSVVGGYIDAIADKIMINTSFYMLFYIDMLPGYIFYITILRDIIIITGTALNHNNNLRAINPIFLSKINTFVQFTLVVFCILFLANIVNLNYMQDIINAVVLTTVFSAVEYIYNYRKSFSYKNIKHTSQI